MPINDEATSPVTADGTETLEPGVALCLSGGGYRAMLFHVGTVLRLNHAGWLRKLNRVSSVSGGSITAGVLGVLWNQLQFDNNGIAQRLDLFVGSVPGLGPKTGGG